MPNGMFDTIKLYLTALKNIIRQHMSARYLLQKASKPKNFFNNHLDAVRLNENLPIFTLITSYPTNFHLNWYGSRAFAVSASELWKSVSVIIRSCNNLIFF